MKYFMGTLPGGLPDTKSAKGIIWLIADNTLHYFLINGAIDPAEL